MKIPNIGKSKKLDDLNNLRKSLSKRIFLVLKKNYYVATRNPKLYIALIIGPLLFVLLIGLAFNTSQLRGGLKVAIYDESPDKLILNMFNEVKQVTATSKESKEDCKQSALIKENVVCVIITSTGNSSYTIDTYFDYSRASIYATAYTIVGEVFNKFERELTRNLLNEIKAQVNPENFQFDIIQNDLENTEKELISASKKLGDLTKGLSSDSDFYEYKLDEVITEIKSLKKQITTHQTTINMYRTELQKQKTEAEKIYADIQEMTKRSDTLANTCGTQGSDMSDKLNDANFIELIEKNPNPGCTTIKTINGILTVYGNSFKNIINGINQANDDLEKVQNSLELLKKSTDTYIDDLENEKARISKTEQQYSSEITEFKQSLDTHSEKVAEYGLLIQELNTDLIQFHSTVSPDEFLQKFQRSTRLLSDTRNMLDYTLHLLIPFILLLSSLLISITLNRNEYKTSAFQRNKMQRNNFLIFSGNTIFIWFVMILELLFIILLFKIFFGSNTFQNLPSVLLSASLYILIWVILGFIISRNINSDEGAIFSGTILGLIIFFLSDVVVPMESFPNTILYLYNINPFVYFSEIIRSNYLLSESMNILSTAPLFLIKTLIVFLTIGLFLVWRDMNETHS
jgi:uncharacterized protein YlzI (FlbEa/FlbD family)